MPPSRCEHRRRRDVSQNPEHLAENLDNLRQVNADALVYMGYGMLAAKGLLRSALDELAWDPPRIMSTAFMLYLMGFDKFEGWVGIDQFDPTQSAGRTFHERFVARYGQEPPLWPNAIPVLAYDTARVLVEGLFRAPILVGPGVEGRARDDPLHAQYDGRCAHAHRLCSRYEHGMFRGDWLLYGRVHNGKLEFEGSSSRGSNPIASRQWTTGKTGRAAVRAIRRTSDLDPGGMLCLVGRKGWPGRRRALRYRPRRRDSNGRRRHAPRPPACLCRVHAVSAGNGSSRADPGVG